MGILLRDAPVGAYQTQRAEAICDGDYDNVQMVQKLLHIDGAADVHTDKRGQGRGGQCPAADGLKQRAEQQGGNTEQTGTHEFCKEGDPVHNAGESVDYMMKQSALLDHAGGTGAVQVMLPGYIIHANGEVGDGKAKTQCGNENRKKNEDFVLKDFRNIVTAACSRIHEHDSFKNVE